MVLVCLGACGPDATSGAPTQASDASNVDGDVAEADTVTPDAPEPDAQVGDGSLTGCAKRAENVYVLSTDDDLYRFEPGAKRFTKVGRLGCNAQGGAPNSMAIARDGTAWVDYVSTDVFTGEDTVGALFEVSTEDASCKASPSTLLPAGWRRLGMGFVAADLERDALYVTGTDSFSEGLGQVDTTSGALTPIAPFGAPFTGQSAELTGSAGGSLFAFFSTGVTAIAEIDPEDASILSQRPLALDTPVAWAVSLWRGDFYLYTAIDDGFGFPAPSKVAKYNYETDTLEPDYMPDVGFTIVGAGVSTCATAR